MAFIDTVQRKLGIRGSGPSGLSQDDMGALHVSPAGMKYGELARAERIFGATSGTGTATAPIQAIPTTTGEWNLYNPIHSGRDLYVLTAFCWSVSGTLGLGMSLLGAVGLGPVTAPTDYASSVKSSLNSGGFNSKTIFDNASTFIATPAWVVLASRDQVSAVSVGSGLVAQIDGFMKVRPGFMASLAVLAPVGTTALFGAGFTWVEKDID